MIGNKMTSFIPYAHETNDIWVNDSPYNEQSLINKHRYLLCLYFYLAQNSI